MIQMEFAKFLFKFNNQMLPNSFDEYFIKLGKIHNYNTRQKQRNEFFSILYRLKKREKSASRHLFRCVEKYSAELLSLFFLKI